MTGTDTHVEIDDRLNEELEQSFPASDPPALTQPRRAASRSTEEASRPKVRDTVQARQGVVGHGVRYVLAIGLVLALIAGAVLLYTIWV